MKAGLRRLFILRGPVLRNEVVIGEEVMWYKTSNRCRREGLMRYGCMFGFITNTSVAELIFSLLSNHIIRTQMATAGSENILFRYEAKAHFIMNYNMLAARK